MNYPLFSTRCRQALKLQGLRQVDLSQLTGIAKSSICTYLSGEYLPKRENLHKMATALNVSESWLLGLEDDPEHEDSRSHTPETIYDSVRQMTVQEMARDLLPLLSQSFSDGLPTEAAMEQFLMRPAIQRKEHSDGN